MRGPACTPAVLSMTPIAEPRTGSAPRRPLRWRNTLLFLAAVLLGLYSLAGMVMAGSLQGSGYRIAARVYLVLLALSLVSVVGVVVWRWRRRNDP
jgi:hypothetical protein